MIAFPDEPPATDHTQPNDPTPKEIVQRAAAIRRGWSDAQRKRRRVLPQPTGWLPPLVMLADVSANLPSNQTD